MIACVIHGARELKIENHLCPGKARFLFEAVKKIPPCRIQFSNRSQSFP
jgi:hypothetical protein